MRVSTQVAKKRRPGRPKKNAPKPNPITKEVIMDLKKNGKHLCGDMTYIQRHYSKTVTTKHSAQCAMCGGQTQQKCELCGVWLHKMPTNGKYKGKMCWFEWHSDVCVGLGRDDFTGLMKGTNKDDWQPPNKRRKQQHKKLIEKILAAKQDTTGVKVDKPEPPIKEVEAHPAAAVAAAPAPAGSAVDPAQYYQNQDEQNTNLKRTEV